MKHSLGIVLGVALMLVLSACGGTAKDAAKESRDAEYAACIQEWAQDIANYEGGTAADHTSDPGVIATCEGFRDLDEAIDDGPVYTPAPAVELDQECLREWAENSKGLFEGMTTEEIMEDPMARMNCE
ncbi:hypothetical protein [Paeniglutamicibacter terrestris]|uniref:Secreted protein n=1 Tax=Paeniglutamicibacter terrestris TaxID=2723403 RepID=A0ABX1G4F9_9MICC|nr:hypothetical protein [Paeniglutamicibacter terrestris]NKG21130.1 hypothetical protein [Paeniglutamicibacter terrestris]